MALVAAGATAAAAAGLAYLDGRYQIRQDLAVLRGKRLMRKYWAQAAKQKRISLYYFFEKRAAAQPDAEAIWSRAGTYTRSQVLSRIHQYAQWYLSQCIQPGDLVALFLPNSPEFIFAWAGLWAIGAAPAMINYHLTGQALLHCVKISTAKLVLVDGDAAALGRIETVRPELEKLGMRVIPFRDVKSQALSMPDTRPPDALREGLQLTFPMALFYTSGTTGLPKAAAMPTIAGFFHGIGREAGSSPFVPDTSTRYYDCMPYYHGTGGINAMACLMCGATLCIAPRFSVSGFWADVRESGATWFVYVGETVRYLLAAPPSDMDKKHNVHSIYGNGLRPDVWRRFRDRFGITKVFEMFNSTEGMLQLDNPSRGDFTINAVGHHGLLLRRKYHDSYVPVLVDTDTGELARDERTGFAIRVPYEVGGEILVKLPFERTFAGYWRNPEATAKKYVENVFVKGDKYFRTGDALRRDADGRWYFMDRLGDTFRWKGENVSTAEVSECLGKYPGILEANVYGVQLPGHDGKAGAAAIFIDPALSSTFDHRSFLAHCRQHLPKYAVPMFVRHVSAPSSTHNNKQNKVPLKKEGVHPDKVANGDKVLWVDKHGRGDTYVPFTRQDWDNLQAGTAKL